MKFKNKNIYLGITFIIFIALFILLSLSFVKSDYVNGSSDINDSSNQSECIRENFIQISENCREEQSSYFKNELNLSKESFSDNESLDSFIERKQNNSLNLINVFKLALNINENQRLFMAKDLLLFDRDFINRFISFSTKDSRNSENIKSQLIKYADDVSMNKTFNLNITDEKINNLYSNNNTTDFIDSIVDSQYL